MSNSSTTAVPERNLQKSLGEALFTGIISCGLFVLLIGFKSAQNIRNELILNTRWPLFWAVVAIATVGRFVMSYYIRPNQAANKMNKPAPKAGVVEQVGFFQRHVRLIVLIGLFLYPVIFLLGKFDSQTGIITKILDSLLTVDGTPANFVGSTLQLISTLSSLLFLSVIALLMLRATGIISVPTTALRSNVARPVSSSFLDLRLNQLMLAALIFYPVAILLNFTINGSLKWVDNFGIQILIYVMLAWGLNIVVGLAGLLDLGYVAFYAVGAYSYALLSSNFGLSFWVLLPLAGILSAFWGIILGFPVLRLRGDYLAIVTLAFGEIIRLVLINWTAVTKGGFGISGIAKATLFGFMEFNAKPDGFAAYFGLAPSSAYYKIFLYYLILALAMLTAFVTIRLRRLPIGRAWEALREDEVACRSLGINTTTTKLTAFAIGAMFGGFAGAFFAVRQGFVSPESFVFLESAIILAIVVLGGMGSLTGIAIAAVVMIGGTELLREIDFLKVIFGDNFTPEHYRMLIFGLAMVVIMLYKPRGFVGTREPTAFLHSDHRAISGEFSKEGHG